jgi:hypothetical protein
MRSLVSLRLSWGRFRIPEPASLFTTGRRTFRLPTLSTRHRTSFGHVIPLPATQGLSTEVPAGGRPGLVDRTAPHPCSAAVRLLFAQVPAGGVSKKIAAFFFEPALAEIMQLGGFALPDKDDGEPAAAFTAGVAGAGCRNGLGGFHCSTSLYRNGTKRVRFRSLRNGFF